MSQMCLLRPTLLVLHHVVERGVVAVKVKTTASGMVASTLRIVLVHPSAAATRVEHACARTASTSARRMGAAPISATSASWWGMGAARSQNALDKEALVEGVVDVAVAVGAVFVDAAAGAADAATTTGDYTR